MLTFQVMVDIGEVLAGLFVVGIIFCTGVVWLRTRTWRDGLRVYNWLAKSTCDKPGESHKSLLEIAEGARLRMDRVRFACLHNTKISESISKPRNYSIWRKEPHSMHERGGLVIF